MPDLKVALEELKEESDSGTLGRRDPPRAATFEGWSGLLLWRRCVWSAPSGLFVQPLKLRNLR